VLIVIYSAVVIPDFMSWRNSDILLIIFLLWRVIRCLFVLGCLLVHSLYGLYLGPKYALVNLLCLENASKQDVSLTFFHSTERCYVSYDSICYNALRF